MITRTKKKRCACGSCALGTGLLRRQGTGFCKRRKSGTVTESQALIIRGAGNWNWCGSCSCGEPSSFSCTDKQELVVGELGDQNSNFGDSSFS